MECPKCKSIIDSTSEFCEKCGFTIEANKSRLQKDNETSSRIDEKINAAMQRFKNQSGNATSTANPKGPVPINPSSTGSNPSPTPAVASSTHVPNPPSGLAPPPKAPSSNTEYRSSALEESNARYSSMSKQNEIALQRRIQQQESRYYQARDESESILKSVKCGSCNKTTPYDSKAQGHHCGHCGKPVSA